MAAIVSSSGGAHFLPSQNQLVSKAEEFGLKVIITVNSNAKVDKVKTVLIPFGFEKMGGNQNDERTKLLISLKDAGFETVHLEPNSISIVSKEDEGGIAAISDFVSAIVGLLSKYFSNQKS